VNTEGGKGSVRFRMLRKLIRGGQRKGMNRLGRKLRKKQERKAREGVSTYPGQRHPSTPGDGRKYMLEGTHSRKKKKAKRKKLLSGKRPTNGIPAIRGCKKKEAKRGC